METSSVTNSEQKYAIANEEACIFYTIQKYKLIPKDATITKHSLPKATKKR